MKRLSKEVATVFNEGMFVAKFSEGCFNGVWADYALEVTEHKALRGLGGIVLRTLRGNALARYILAKPVTAKYSITFKKEVCEQKKSTSDKHHSDNKASTRKWNSSIEKMDTMFEAGYLDPFDTVNPPKAPSQLFNRSCRKA